MFDIGEKVQVIKAFFSLKNPFIGKILIIEQKHYLSGAEAITYGTCKYKVQYDPDDNADCFFWFEKELQSMERKNKYDISIF